MPKLGQTMTEGRVVRWLKSEGDSVKKGDIVVEIETDKSVFEVEAAGGGVLRKIFVEEDQTVPVATTLAYIADPDEEIPKEPKTPIAKKPDQSEVSVIPEPTAHVLASPRVRRFAKEKGIDLSKVKSSDPRGIISVKDVEEYIVTQSSARSSGQGKEFRFPEVAGVYELEKEEPMSVLRKRISERLRMSVQSALHVSSTIEIDAISMKKYLTGQAADTVDQSQIKITYTDLLVSLVARVLREMPQFNATCDGQNIRYIKNVNIGVAVAVPRGLMVPVIRNADQKTIPEISRELRTLAEKALSGKLTPEEYSYGTFTISNLGMFGIESFTSIINPPESAILGVGVITDQPRVINGQIAICPVFKATLNIDHRLVDGVLAAQFLNKLKIFCEEYA